MSAVQKILIFAKVSRQTCGFAPCSTSPCQTGSHLRQIPCVSPCGAGNAIMTGHGVVCPISGDIHE